MAQQDSRGFSLMNFQASPVHNGFLSVEGARLPKHLSFVAGSFFNYQYRPLMVRGCESATENTCTNWTNQKIPLIEHRLVAEVLGAISFFGVFEAGVAVPIVLYQAGQDITGTLTSQTMEGPDSAFGLEDIRLHLKLDILGGLFGYDGGKHKLSLALVPVVSFPIGNTISEESFMGDSFITFHPKMAFGAQIGRVRFGLNAGYLLIEKKESYLAKVGSRISYGGAAEVIFTKNLSAVAEAFGQLAIDEDRASAPLEAAIAGRYKTNNGLQISLGIGTGIVSGLGTPLIRGLAALTWTRAKQKKPTKKITEMESKMATMTV